MVDIFNLNTLTFKLSAFTHEQVVMKELLDNGLLHGDCLTVTGKTVAENLQNVTKLSDIKQVLVSLSHHLFISLTSLSYRMSSTHSLLRTLHLATTLISSKQVFKLPFNFPSCFYIIVLHPSVHRGIWLLIVLYSN